LNSLIKADDTLSEQSLATAQWAKPDDITKLAFEPGSLWMGRAADEEETAIGFRDDRHALIVAGNRSGKGTSAIVPNLSLWPGSIVVIDPKGENATITAARRAAGSEYCDGLDQRTFVLDPFKTAKISDDLRASFNPIDALDPNSDEAVDDAGRIADAIVVSQNTNDPFWDEQARTLIKGLILHILTSEDFDGKRSLVTVRKLITSGDVDTRKTLEELGEDDIPTPFELLFEGMRRNDSFHGIVAGAGETFGNLASTSTKTLSGVLSAAGNHTEFIDSLPMQRQLAATTPGFALSQLKTDPMGVSIFLSLPQRFMNTHFRWLRMMVALIITEMEKTPGQPAVGSPVLLVLDEFAGLKKMEIIENAAAQIAGFGVKMCFILQNLTQLKSVYKDNWEVFVGNAGVKLFFGIEDNFTREYVSKQLGETEVARTTRNASETRGTSRSRTQGSSSSSSTSTSEGSSSSNTYGFGTGSSENVGALWNSAKTSNSNASTSFTSGSNMSSSTSSSFSTNESSTIGDNESRTAGRNEGIHKRALMTPDEVGMLLSRLDEKDNPAYPGLALALASGKRPILVRRTNYFEDRAFERTFDPHPDHGFSPLLEPKPETVQVLAAPPLSDISAMLQNKYGEDNTKRAYALAGQIRREHPQLSVNSRGMDRFVEDIFRLCERSVAAAGEDGRTHSVTETMAKCEQNLARNLTENTYDFDTMIYLYGDENDADWETVKGIFWLCVGVAGFGYLIWAWLS